LSRISCWIRSSSAGKNGASAGHCQ
jgi:hypothetical protein